MDKLLIAVGSEELTESLIALLDRKREIRVCFDGDTALELLEAFRPEQLIIDLHLPLADGLTVLQSTQWLPATVLALTYSDTPYAIQAARDAGAGHIMRLPCRACAIVRNLDEMLRIAALPDQQADPQKAVGRHLYILNIPGSREGFQHLRVGVPLYRQDRHQSVTKELYPAIAEVCGNDNGAQVETAIRNVIGDAWARRNADVWEEYFPGKRKCPTNKQFIAGLAEKL